MEYPDPVIDKQMTYFGMFDQRQREYIRSLINDDIIEEHSHNHQGQHSLALERVLSYVRSRSKHMILQKDLAVAEFTLVFSTGDPANPYQEEAGTYASTLEAEHAVFLRLIESLTADTDGEE